MFQSRGNIPVGGALTGTDFANAADIKAADTLFPEMVGRYLWKAPASQGGQYYVANKARDARDRKIMSKSAWTRTMPGRKAA